MTADEGRGADRSADLKKRLRDGFDAAAREFARELAQGPTLAHAATKRVVRDYLDGGVELANERASEVAGELFATEDLQGAVRSFLDEGPGQATFQGR